MRLSNHPHNYADPPEVISTGDGWRVRISGCDTFDQVNELGCKQYRAFDVAQGLATREEAEQILRQYLNLAAARLPQPAPAAWIKPDVLATLTGDECCYAFGSQNPKGSLVPLYAEPPLPQVGPAACASCGSTTGEACNDKGCGHLESGNGEPGQKTFTVFVRQSNDQGTTWVGAVQAADIHEASDLGLGACAADWSSERVTYSEDDLRVIGIAEGDVKILIWDDIE